LGAFIDGAFDPDAGADVDSHGSHVCGTIGGRPRDEGHFAGLAPGVDLFAARVFPPDAGANQGDIANAIDALSRDQEVDLINLSLGAPQGSQIELDAILDAFERGTLCVCAAANSSGPVEFPAAFEPTVAVSALGLLGWGPAGTVPSVRLPTQPDRFGANGLYLANFSCFGPEITCAGPGVGILSTVPARHGIEAPFASMGGTSMASPAVCGTLAAILSLHPVYRSLPRDQTRAEMARSILRQSCRDVDLGSDFQGAGVPFLSHPEEAAR
jgi:subtilisin